MRKKFLEASFTVEAAFVIPIVIIVIMAVVYMSFYLHDNVVEKAVSYAYILKTRGEVSAEEISESIKNYTISATHINSQIDKTDDSVKVKYDAETNLPFQAMGEYLGSSINDINKCVSVDNLYKSDFIRMTKAAKDVLKGE